MTREYVATAYRGFYAIEELLDDETWNKVLFGNLSDLVLAQNIAKALSDAYEAGFRDASVAAAKRDR